MDVNQLDRNQLQWLPAFRDLSDEQTRAITESLEGCSLIYGPAGSGKTAVTVYRAKTLLDQGKSFQVFLFTQVLLRFISTAAKALDFPTGRVESFYKWVWQTHKELIGTPPGNGGEEKFSASVDALIQYFQAHPENKPKYEYILIDEGQDFKLNVSQLLHMLSDNIFVAGDTSQSLYVDITDWHQLSEWWKAEQSSILIKNYRNPKTVANIAAVFLNASPIEQVQFLESVQDRPSEAKPVWYQVDSAEEQTQKIKALVDQARGATRIGILFKEWEQLEREKSRLEAQGVALQVAYSNTHQRRASYDFENTSAPILTTIHSAKGLEFDWVILPDLTTEVWDKTTNDSQQRRLFFVALTRAKSNLYLISQKEQECMYLKEIPSDLLQAASEDSPF